MAAAELGLPPGFHFEPTDEEVVGLYLVRRILGQKLPPGDIISADPLSAAPWDLLKEHSRKKEAFFFAEGQTMNAKGSRKKRTCPGAGAWEGQGKRKRQEDQDEVEGKKLRVQGCDKEIEWEKYALNFHEFGSKGSTGWVMHEYSITAPPELAQSLMRVYRIRFSGHGKNAKRQKTDSEDWGSDDEGEAEEVGDAAPVTTLCAVEEEPAQFVVEEDPSQFVVEEDPARFVVEEDPARFVVEEDPVQFVVEEDPARFVVEEDPAQFAVEEDPGQFVVEYPSAPQAEYVASFPEFARLAADLVNGNPADGADAGAANDQALMDYMNSLADLLPMAPDA